MTDLISPSVSVESALVEAPKGRLPGLPERFQPQNLTELMSWSKLVVKSGLAPKGMSDAAIVIAVQMGSELNITPTQALQNIAVINGRPSIWGDLGLALFIRDATYVSLEERGADQALAEQEGLCRITMKDGRVIERHFSVDDAKKANLWTKQGPWQQYPGRMLQMRARWFAMRDADPGVFKGCAAREEQEDIREAEVTSVRTVEADIDEFLKGSSGGGSPQGGQHAAPPANAKEPESNPYKGELNACKKKEGKTGKRKWTKWNVGVGEHLFGTFDAKLKDEALALGKGKLVLAHWEVKDGYLTLTGIEPEIVEAGPDEGGEGSEDIFGGK